MQTTSDLTELAAQIAVAEHQVPNLRPGCEKRIIWAGEKGAQTDVALVYLHGFSASPEEIRPVPDLVANAMGANLFYARLTGHGQNGIALGAARLEDWIADTKEAIEICAALGRKVIVMGCSTGCTLMTIAGVQGAQVDGYIHVSANFGMRHRVLQWVLDLPGARQWGPWISGFNRHFDPISDAHSAYWTTDYPTQAVFTMAETVRAARAGDPATIQAPALFVYCAEDRVVNPSDIKRVMAAWGGDVREHIVTLGAGDDANAHIIAGDVFSPSQTASTADVMIRWAQENV
ncbi:alpha/beta hydrolase [Aestuariibius sp. HNIBRBA575]|uniref:alpha/beta hydrolase n=1 Tax=Aestuariibius sp. HNIBRBA575 TaxID=3233343 RepID=UPI0034A142ED